MPSICLVEDDPIMGESLLERLRLEGFKIDWFVSLAEAAKSINRSTYDLIVSDVRLGDGNGDQLLTPPLRKPGHSPPVLLMTAYGTVPDAVKALKLGASDYLIKPFDIRELIDRVNELTGKVNSALIKNEPPTSEPKLGVSAAMQRIESQIGRLAAKAKTVLICGESGVGKEVAAQLCHQLGKATHPGRFVPVNCAAIPETLMESALFGHEKGAFTGADRRQPGYFEQAHQGTLFLDEIGDLPLNLQGKLLRVLQDRKVRRLGGTQDFDANLRVVCATHQSLEKLVSEGRFRLDLLYRINVVQLEIPPLRERPEDILWLAERFLDAIGQEADEPRKALSSCAKSALLQHPWMGNVREMRNRLERAFLFTEGGTIRASDLFEQLYETSAPPALETVSLEVFVNDAEKSYLLSMLKRNQGRIIDTARALGISRKTLWEKMRRYSLSSTNL